MKKLKVIAIYEDIESSKIHKEINNKNRLAGDTEINFIIEFKKQYPIISISQFQDIYNETFIFNPKMKDTVKIFHSI